MSAAAKDFHSPAALCRFLLVAALLLAADLFVKSYAFSHLALSIQTDARGIVRVEGRTVELIPGWVHLDLTANQGMVLGFAQGARFLFIVASIAAIIFLFYLFARSGRQAGYQLILGMLMAGVLGNLYDRVRLGYVRDMIHALPGWHYPHWFISMLPDVRWKYNEVFPWVFNVADMLLTTGVFLLLVHGLYLETLARRKSAAPPPDTASANPAT